MTVRGGSGASPSGNRCSHSSPENQGGGQVCSGSLEAPAKWDTGVSQGGAVAPRKEKIRASARLTPRVAFRRQSEAVSVGLAPSSYSRQIMTVIKIINA